MRRGPSWSYGILLVMVGIVVGIMGLMLALMQVTPARGMWAIAGAGVGIIVVGASLARSAAAPRDRSLPANDKRIPSARVHRSARR